MFDKESHPLTQLDFLKQRENWKTEDIYVDDFRLEIAGHPVMERWEEPYMKRLAEIASMNGGKVLEVGFGLGIAASYIQENLVKEHHIIEANDQVFERMKFFAKSAKCHTVLHSGFWEDVSSKFENEFFDGILFDTYPITFEELHTARFSFFSEAYRLLKVGGVFTHYSGELDFTDEYISYLLQTGFSNFSGELISVTPPKDCLYWNHYHIMAPTIIKI
jgi:guanidinoacetate N-methyltransferase